MGILSCNGFRGGSKTAAKSKMERFVIIVNGFQPLTIITKHSILDVAAVLDRPLGLMHVVSMIKQVNRTVLLNRSRWLLDIFQSRKYSDRAYIPYNYKLLTSVLLLSGNCTLVFPESNRLLKLTI